MDILFSLDMGEADFGHLVSVTPSEHPTASAKLRVRPCDTAIQLHAFIPQATLREYLIMVLSEEHSTIALAVFPPKGVNEHTTGLSTSGCPSIDADLSVRCKEAFLRPFLGSDYSFTHRRQPPFRCQGRRQLHPRCSPLLLHQHGTLQCCQLSTCAQARSRVSRLL